MMLSFKYRIKDARVHKYLDRYARAVNRVWNYCNQIQREAEARWQSGRSGVWPTAFDLIRLCTGSSAELGIHSDTVQSVCREYVARRNANKGHLRWRASQGPKRALGWVPFLPRAVRIDGSQITYFKRKFCFWKSRDFTGIFKAGRFVQDARGRWYVCFQCEISEKLTSGKGEIGIDLGLKALATCSDGTVIPALHHYRRYEAKLAIAQRAKNKKRVRAIHAKIANARRHNLHEQSTKITRENELIVVGNISPTMLTKTKMAKSILDVSWSMLRSQLRYKASRHGARYVEVSERLTTQTCSNCGTVGGPKGIAGLGIRHWVCPCCGSTHDRDVNAARNILCVGAERRPPAVEILAS